MKTTYSEAHAEQLRRLLRNAPQVTERAMLGHPAFFANDRMFAVVYGAGVALKLPERQAKELLLGPDVEPFGPPGRPNMREWIVLNRDESSDYSSDVGVLMNALDHALSKRP
jgi:hypothetical protein